MKVCRDCGIEIETNTTENQCLMCCTIDNIDMKRTLRAIRNEQHRKSAAQNVAESLGLVRDRGSLGGVYYE